MIAYVDASIILRKLFGQPRALREWPRVREAVGSALVELECLRTIDRLRLVERLSEEETARRRAAVYTLLESFELMYPTRVILERAALPMATAIGSLDAVHLATALVWQERTGKRLVMATHDEGLGAAARANGMKVVGCTR